MSQRGVGLSVSPPLSSLVTCRPSDSRAVRFPSPAIAAPCLYQPLFGVFCFYCDFSFDLGVIWMIIFYFPNVWQF